MSFDGRILSDHIRDNRSFDRSDVIIIHALEFATDADLKEFRIMVGNIDSNGYIVQYEKYHECLDWCVKNRIFDEIRNVVEDTTYITFAGVRTTIASRRLQFYIDEIKQLFRDYD